MTPDAFDALVAKLERHAASQPLLYCGEILGLAALGYGFLLLLLAICLLVAGAAGLLVLLKVNALTLKHATSSARVSPGSRSNTCRTSRGTSWW